MVLTSDLVSEFVKITNDSNKNVEETTVYGTIVEHEGSNYVRLDGSELLTPITTATVVKPGERVTVMIKNHTATVTGNLSSPAARIEDVDDVVDVISDFEIVIAQKVDTKDFVAEQARIDSLVAEDVVIKESLTAAEADIDTLQTNSLTVTERLEAVEADIEELIVGNLDVSVLDAKYAKIEDLEATNADLHNLESTYANFETTTTNKLSAVDASILDLQTNKLSADTADITYAKISDLDTTNANITNLTADVADIDTLIFGSASGDVIQTSFSNAVIAQLGDAQIKSAMIESISADKITAGDIITNNVRVRSEDGLLLISDETIQISDIARVRVQIGKDSSNDYSINIWDADGNLMFSKGGITDSAIKEAIIRNDMVSDTANIAAHKLDIDSLFEEINGSTNTIKSTQIYLNDQAQTLDAAFKELETEITNLGSTVSSQGTQISVIQGQISSKVWQQDIDTVKNELGAETNTLSTQYSALDQKVNSISATVASNTTAIETKADSSTVTSVNNKVTSLETNLSGLKSTVSDTNKTLTLMSGDPTNYACLNTKTAEQLGFTVMDDEWFSPNTLKRDTKISNLYECFGGEKLLIEYEYSSNVQGASTTGGTDIAYANVGIGVYCKKLSTSGDYSWLVTGNAPSTEEAPVTKISQVVTIPDAARYFTINFQLGRWPTFTGSVKIRNVKVSKIDALVDRVATAETSISQNSKEIALRAKSTDVTKEINNIAIGGRNLIRDSKLDKDTDMWQLDLNHHTISFENGYFEVSRVYDASYTNRTFNNQDSTMNPLLMPDEISDKTYVLQAELKAIDGISPSTQSSIFWRVYYDNSGSYEEITMYIPADLSATEWRRCWATRTFSDKNWTNSQVTIALANVDNGVCVRNIMLERATKPSNWSLAPEDVDTAVENAQLTADEAQITANSAEERAVSAESLIQLLFESISMLVVDSNGESLMTQTDSGWTFSTAQIHDAIESTSTNLNNLTNEVGSVSSTVDILKQSLNDLGILNDYVKIGTYENEPCIELGESDSNFKLIITNTRIMFMEGSGVPAYINNQSLYIKKAVIEQELQQGEFVWKARSNGNLGLIWKGVNS